ncbi:protein of unknown function [Candidatus Filomicrobium marinum]|nr:protein of unknown function [Candidatus Filomicrobium marinum]
MRRVPFQAETDGKMKSAVNGNDAPQSDCGKSG